MKNNFTILSTKILKPYIAQQLVDNDFNIIEHNFIEIEPQKLQDFQSILKQQTDHYIFTSKNAVKCFANKVEEHKIQINKQTKMYSISGETQQVLIGAGFKATLVAENAEALANDIVAKANIKNALFFCGNKRRPDLLNILFEADIDVKEVVLYHTNMSHINILEPYQVILFFSPSAVQSFFAENDLHKTTACFCVGYTTTKLLKFYKPNQKIITCNYPSQQNMVDDVLLYFNKKN